MPNRTIYITKEQEIDFIRGQQAAKALDTSVGTICATALKQFADENQPRVTAVTNAKKGNSQNVR